MVFWGILLIQENFVKSKMIFLTKAKSFSNRSRWKNLRPLEGALFFSWTIIYP